MTAMSWLEEAWVVSQDPDNEAVFVSLTGPHGGQGPALSVRVGGSGPRDGVTGHFPALPTAGTHGLVGFPRLDHRNGVWLCSVLTQQTDASAHVPGNGAADYAAHYGGGFSYRAETGAITESLPEGTVIQIGPAPPTLTRHTVDQNQARQRTPFLPAQRVAQAPGTFAASITAPNGASAVLTASGAWQMTAASGQAISLTAGGTTWSIDGSGNVTVSGDNTVHITGSGVVAITAGGALTVSSSSSVTVSSSTVVNIVAPSITAGNGGSLQAVQLANSTSSTVFKAQ